MTTASGRDQPANWPTVTFLLPVLNGGKLLPGLLQSIRDQDYPAPVEIIMADGGSTDDSVAIAQRFGVKVVPNPYVLAEAGNVVAYAHATGDILFYVACDNGLPRKDWLRLMVRPFLERASVMGTYTQIIPSPGDNSFTEYYCRMHVEPFTWFVYGDACNPRDFHKHYNVRYDAKSWIVYDFAPMTHPLIAFAQGFGVRRGFKRRQGYENCDILPVIQLIEEGGDLAYVPEAGVYHHHLNNFAHYVKKYRWRIFNNLNSKTSGFDNRPMYMTRWRKAKKYLFALYGLSIVGPLVGAVRLVLKERRLCMLWHAPATYVMVGLAFHAYAKKLIGLGAVGERLEKSFSHEPPAH